MNQRPPIELDLSNAQDIKCERPGCGNYTFQEVVLMKKVSALLSPNGKAGIVPIPTFACNVCGHVNAQFLPVKLNERSTVDNESQPLTSEARPSLTLER